MVISCDQVWQEVSNYLDGEVSSELRHAIDQHLRGCKNCTAVLDGARNVIQVYGDERMVELPAGFSQRLRRRLEENTPRRKGNAWGWMVAFAMAAMLLAGFEVGNTSAVSRSLRDNLAKQASHIPPDLMVIVTDDGKMFHVAGCTFIHDKSHLRSIPASEAMREGYSPCTRCLRKYLGDSVAKASIGLPLAEVADTDDQE